MTRQAGETRGSRSTDADVAGRITKLLQDAGMDAAQTAIVASGQSGNNRIYRVDTDAGVFAVKQYFRHPDDERDRLGTETAFLEYADITAPGVAPRLYRSDPDTGLALLEFVDGQPFKPGDVGGAHVEAAVEFFRQLNAAPARGVAHLPIASEARFSIAGHLALIDERVNRLLQVDGLSAGGGAAGALGRRLRALWRQVAANVTQATANIGLALETELLHHCISPSDFGFHNALITPHGRVRFVDFEYAGWDDPAKTAGDFFAQLAVPVPDEYFDRFVEGCMGVLPDAASSIERARLLRPAYQIKWCCIALGVFLPTHMARRRFANPSLDADALKRAQLAKAERLMQLISTHRR